MAAILWKRVFVNVIDYLKTLPHVEPNADYLNAADYYPFLNALARDLKATRVLEIGVRFGYSAVAFILGNPVREYAGIDYDLYDPTSSIKSRENLDCLKRAQPVDVGFFKKNTQELDDLAFLGSRTFDFIHIDGDHSFDGALTDLKNFWNVLEVGGHMLVDDSTFYGSVHGACVEFADLIEEPSYDVKTYRGTWVFLKTRERTFPITKSLINECTPAKPVNEEDVVKRFKAEHTGWSGNVILLKDGTFRGGLNSPDGRYTLEGEILTLKWHHWPKSTLKSDGAGSYISLNPADNLRLRDCELVETVQLQPPELSSPEQPKRQEVQGPEDTPENPDERTNGAEVFKHFIAIHIGWSGIMRLLKDGTFKGGLHNPDGRWTIDGNILTLKWHHWPESKLKSENFESYVSLNPADDISLQEYDPAITAALNSFKGRSPNGDHNPFNKETLTEGIYLNLGCGGNILPQPWSNHDLDMDITKPLPFGDEAVNAVLVEHTVEHIDGPSGLRFFDECHRILKPGAVLRVCVPTIPQLRGKHLRDIILQHGHCVFFSDVTLRALLRAAGFEDDKIELTGRKECDGHWKIIGDELDRIETCRMEATK